MIPPFNPSQRFSPLNPSLENPLNLRLSNGICLEKKYFNGSIPEAMAYLNEFCSQNDIRYKSHGHGYGTLTVNGEEHHITPYGIDLDMMLQFCGGKTYNDFPRRQCPQ